MGLHDVKHMNWCDPLRNRGLVQICSSLLAYAMMLNVIQRLTFGNFSEK